MTVYVVFFRGAGWLPFLIRLFTWRWWQGQRFADVPAHCGILLGDTYYEAIVTGVRQRQATPAQLQAEGARLRAVTIPMPLLASVFAEGCIGDRYDFAAIEMSLTASHHARRFVRRHLWDCSEFVYIVLAKGGRSLPCTDGPARPNDLALLLPKASEAVLI